MVRRGVGRQVSPEQQQEQAITAVIKSQNPDIASNPRAWDYARAEWERLRILGKKEGWELIGEVMRNTRQALRMADPNGRPAPTEAVRRKFSGVGGGGGGVPEGPRTVVMTKAQQNMAKAMYPKLEPKDAYKQWAKKVGRKLG